MGKDDNDKAPARQSVSRRGRWAQAFGYDVFISYNRAEAAPYATAMHRTLDASGLVCFLDDHETAPGLELTPTIERALRRSRVLVLIASPAALRSKWVGRELLTFSVLRRPIIPVSLQGALSTRRANGSPFDILAERDIAWLDEDPAVSPAGTPSERVVKRVRSFFGLRRSVLMLRASVATTVVALAGLAALTWGQARLAIDNDAAAVVQSARGQVQSGRPREAVAQLLQSLERPRWRSAQLNEQLRDSLSWAISHWAPLIEHPAAADVRDLQFTPDGGAMIVGVEGKGLAIYKSGEAEAQATVAIPPPMASFALHPAGGVILVGSGVGSASLFDAASGRLVRTLASESEREDRTLAFLPDGSPVTGSDDGIVRLWRLADGTVARRYRLASGPVLPQGVPPLPPLPGDKTEAVVDDGVLALASSEDGRLLAAGGRGGAIKVWRLGSGEEPAVDIRVEGSVHALVFDAAGEQFALARYHEERSSYSEVARKGIVEIRRVKDGAKLFERDFGSLFPTLRKAATTGCLFVGAAGVTALPFGSTSTTCPEKTLGDRDATSSFALDREGRRLAFARPGGTIEIWSTQDWQLLARFTSPASTKVVGSMAFHPSAPRLAVGGRPLSVWNIDRYQVPTAFSFGGAIQELAPDGGAALLKDWDGNWMLQRRGEGQPRVVFDKDQLGSVKLARFSPDSGQVVVVADRVSVWDGRTGSLVRQWNTEVPSRANALSLHFDTSGPSFVLSGRLSGSGKEDAWIFDTHAGAPLTATLGPFSTVRDFRAGLIASEFNVRGRRVELFQVRPWGRLFEHDLDGPVQAMRITADGRGVVLLREESSSVASATGITPIGRADWNLRAPLASIPLHEAQVVAVSAKGRTAFWDGGTGAFLFGAEGTYSGLVSDPATGIATLVVRSPKDNPGLVTQRLSSGMEVQRVQTCAGAMRLAGKATTGPIDFMCGADSVLYSLPLLPQGPALLPYARELLR